MHAIDWAVLPVYLVGITALGVWTARVVKTSGDFFMPRRFGKAMMITFAFGTGTSSDQAVTVASKTISNGLSAIWWQWLWLPATPFYWVLAPIMRRLRAVTTADVYELRYDRSVAVLYALVGIFSLGAKIGLLLLGAGVMIDSCTGGVVNANWAILAVTAMFVIYGMAGGLGAAIVTDFVQGIMTVVFSFMLLPYVLHATGGLEGVRRTIAAHDTDMLSLVQPGGIGWFFIAMYAVQALVGIVAQPFIMGVCGAGKTEFDGRVGFMVGNIVKRICTMAWSLTSLAAVAWLLSRNVDLKTYKPDYLYGDVAREFLPKASPGLLGVFLACLLASIMSACNSVMISSAALFTENLYRPLFSGRPDRHYLLVGRLASLGVVIGGVAFAYSVTGVVHALDIWFKISPMIGIAFWIGFFWRRATPLGAWAGTLAAAGTWMAVTRPAFAAWAAGQPWLVDLGAVTTPSAGPPAVAAPWDIVAYMLAGVAATVLVSLVTPRADAERVQRFYDLTRTPVEAGEVVLRPCTLPVGMAPKPRAMLLTWAGLEVPLPSATSLTGFAVGWLAVGLMVWVFVWLVS